MHVDAVLILRRLVGEIVGEAEHAREFVAGLGIEIGIARAGIDRAVSDADVRHARRVIGADGYVAGDVGHVVVNAVIPAQRRDRPDITETGDRGDDGVAQRSPTRVTESLMVWKRETGNVPGGAASEPVTLPAKDVSTRP